MAESIKVMIVDDSAVVRQVVAKALAEAPGIEVVGVANDPLFALDRMRNDWPDVLVVDIEMPRMDGIAFVRKIMAERPTPVIICSSLAEPGSQASIDALAAGAVAVITKPKLGLKGFLEDSAQEFVQTIRSAAKARPRRSIAAPLPSTSETAPPLLERTTEQVIAIGASTGGFTDCMLQNGAKKVYAVDVGYGQLAWSLRQDPRVKCMERTNIRYVTPDMLE